MRLATALLILLLPLLATPQAAAEGHAEVDAAPREGNLATVFRFSADGRVERGASALRNGAFTDGFAGWTADDLEIQGAASFETAQGGARVSVPLAPLPGTAYLRQRVAVDAGAYELRLTTHGSGDFLGIALLVRESGYAPGLHPLPFLDATFQPPVTAEPTEHRFVWHPREPTSTHAEVFLRIAFRGGDAGEVTFRAVSFSPITSVRWDFGDGTPPAHGLLAQHRYAAPGSFTVAARTWHPGKEPRVETLEVRVENEAPRPAFDLRRAGASGRFVADAAPSLDPDGVETRLRNPGFDEGALGWSFSAAETGVEGDMAAEGGALRLRAGPTRFHGSVFAFQEVAIVPNRSYAFEVSALDGSGVDAYELIARERGSVRGVHDHVARFETAVEAWTRLRMHVAPRFPDSTLLTLHLRVLAPPGALVDVSFDDVTLREDLSYAWLLDGEPVPGAQRRVDIQPIPGNHTLTLLVTDAAGASAVLSRDFDGAVPDAAPRPAILAPAFARAWQPAYFFAAGSRAAFPSEGLVNGDLEGREGWDHAGQAGFADGLARLGPGSEIRQRLPVDPFAPYELHVRHRGAVDAILEAAAVDPSGVARALERRVLRLPDAGAWNDARVPWTALDAATNELRVRLRPAPGVDAEVDAVSFAPALEYEWRIDDGGPQHGYGVRHIFRESGSALVTLVVRDAHGARNATSLTLPVLGNNTFSAVPALSGGVRLAGNLTLDPRFERIEIVRRAEGADAVLAAPLRATFVVADPAPPRDVPLAYDLVLVLDNGTRETVSTAHARLAPGAPVGAVDAPHRLRRGETALLAAVAPADASRVEGILSWGPVRARVAFAPVEDAPGTWEARWTPGPFLPPVAYTLRVVASDEEGRATPLGMPATVDVDLAEGPADAFLILIPLVPLAAWGVRAARRRHGPWTR